MRRRRGGGRSTGAGRNSGRGVEGVRAGQVEQGLSVQVLGNGKLHLVVRVGVTKSVPESGNFVEKLTAANLIPVVLSVVDASNSLIPVGTSVGPASLGHPDRLAASSVKSGLVCLVEESARVLDGIALVVLVVWVLVNTEEVNGVNDDLIGLIAPDIPGVNVADRSVRDSRVLESLLPIINEANNDLRVGANAGLVLNAGGGVAVEILTTNGDTDDQVSEIVAVGVEGLLEGVNLLLNRVNARAPDTEKNVGPALDSSLERLNGVLVRVGLDVGVESDRVEITGGTVQIGRGVELSQEILLELGRAVVKGGSRVETQIVLGRGLSNQGTGGQGSGRETHDCRVFSIAWEVCFGVLRKRVSWVGCLS